MADAHEKHMNEAIGLAKTCEPIASRIPKVGAVIAVGEVVIGTGHRGTGKEKDDDHAELVAIESVHSKTQLASATLYTTLEPCTGEVRSIPTKCCTELIKQFGIRKVFIGILDPNQGVRGKGLWELQSQNIDIELFPPALAKEIRIINQEFIRVQRTLGISITNLQPSQVIRTYDKGGMYEIEGTFLNAPGDDVFAFTGRGGQWYPQPHSLHVTGERKWATRVHFGTYGLHTVCIVKANELAANLVGYYRKIVSEYRPRAYCPRIFSQERNCRDGASKSAGV